MKKLTAQQRRDMTSEEWARWIGQAEKEIEGEEAFGEAIDLSVRELDVYNADDMAELDAEAKKAELKLASMKAADELEQQNAEVERMRVLAGIEAGASKEAAKKVKQMAQSQINRVLKR